MKTIPEIMRVIIGGLMPRSDTGCIMAHLAWYMTYNWRC